MNWKNEAMNLLKDYPMRKDALGSIRERHCMLEKSLGEEPKLDSIPPKGKLSAEQEQLINTLTEKELLRLNYATTKQQVKWIEKGLSGLSPDERLVLEGFYITAGPHAKDDLMDALCIERSALYELKERALRKFTIRMFGTIES